MKEMRFFFQWLRSNFGDVEIEMKEPVSKVIKQQVDTQVIEVTIQRDLVTDWKSTRVALQYLGKTVANLAQGALVALRGFRSYADNKVQAPFPWICQGKSGTCGYHFESIR